MSNLTIEERLVDKCETISPEELKESGKALAISSVNKSYVKTDSVFILHTATSCYQIDKVFLVFRNPSFEEGDKIANFIQKAINTSLK